MKVLKCQGCGSTDFYEENGYRICLYCGTKHLITREDKKEVPKESKIELNEDVQRLLQKWKEDPSRATKYAELILQIDPNNKQALQQVQKKEVSKGGCYVATAVYGSYDCPEVWTLRRYRDFVLADSWYGRLFIRTYYAISPTLVKWYGGSTWFKMMWRPALDRMVNRLNRREFADTPYSD